jgi:hypothetical protein
MKLAPGLAASALILAAVAPAHAGPMEDFAFALKDSTGGEHTRSWVLSKLHTIKVGAKCAARLADKKEGALSMAGFATRDIAAYAKTVTGDDWSAIENQANSDREKQRAIIEPKIDAFKSKLAITITVEGDDCDAAKSALWLRYWTTVAAALKNNPPKAGKVTINLNVTAKAKEVTADSKDGATFTITAPRDVEVVGWSDQLELPFRKAAKK